jgi:hypothetical protein
MRDLIGDQAKRRQQRPEPPAPADDFLASCISIQSSITMLCAARCAFASDGKQAWVDVMSKALRSIEWNTEQLRELTRIPKPRSRCKNCNN